MDWRLTARAVWPLLVLGLLGASAPAAAGAAETVKVGVLQFGTVSWELDVVRAHGFDKEEGIRLEVVPLAGKGATSIALQAGEADIIVTDWVWVARQRAEGQTFTFLPYSTALGAVVVPPDSAVRSLADLKGKRLGVAGGPLDKSWLLLCALARQRHGFDATRELEAVFGAPPLLNEELRAGRLDAVINFWHYAARLEAAGFRRLLGVEEMARALGLEASVPLIGYVFDERWAASNRESVLGFHRATLKAKALLRESDAEWERVRPLMKAEDEATFRALRAGYRAGIPERWGEAERRAAERLFAILAELGGAALVGKAETLDDGTFWPDAAY